MRRLALLFALCACAAVQGTDGERRPPRRPKPAAWAVEVRARLTEGKATLDDARQSHRARLEEARSEGARRKPRTEEISR
jgi:hypothetical protein